MLDDQAIAAFWEEWRADPDRSEERLRLYTLSVVDAAKRAGEKGDWNTLLRLERLYAAGRQYTRAEPLLSAYETGEFHIVLTIADGCYLAGDTRQAFALASGMLESLSIADRRRTKHDLPARPNSELRVIAMGIMAASYFEKPTIVDKQEIQGLVRCFWQVASSLTENLKKPTVRDEARENLIHILAIEELELCKACLHLDAEHQRRSVAAFNRRHGNHLYTELRHFQTLASDEIPSAWYWDYEYAKLLSATDATSDEIEMCAANRVSAARLTFYASGLEMLLRHWRMPAD